MTTDLLYDSSFFGSRDDLEGLQLIRRSLRRMIDSGSKVLPLRRIHRVDMGFNAEDRVHIFVEEPAAGGTPEPDYEASILDGDFAETFRRLQHTFITNFEVGIRDSAFLRYWKAEETAAFTVMNICFYLDGVIDYGVLDSIVNHLRPKTTGDHVEGSSWYLHGTNTAYLELLARDSLLKNLQTCRFYGSAFPPPTFFFNEPGYRNYELCCSYFNAAAQIDGLIESFICNGCANGKLESVWIKWQERDGMRAPAPKQLGKLKKIDMPLPRNDLPAWITRYVYRVSQCETNSFVNKKQWKRMEVYKWTVEYERPDGHITAPILQFRMKDI